MKRVIAALTLFSVLTAATAFGAVRASLENAAVAAGDSVVLRLQYDGQTRDSPDLSPLQQNFDVLSTSRSSNMQIINGAVSSHTVAEVVLAPKHTGQFVIPPLTWGGERSAPLTLTVAAAADGAGHATVADSSPKLFLETTVDQKDPYVQAAVGVIVRVYTSEQLYQAGLEFAGNNDVLVQQVGADRNRTVEKNGRQYEVIERHYVLFPQHSGKLTLPGAVLSGQVATRVQQGPFGRDPFADLFGANGGMVAGAKPIRVHGDDVVLNVQPRPSGIDVGYWLPARSVTLSADWHPDSLQARVGDPITLGLHLRAEGLTAAQLPDLSTQLKLPPGLKAYPDQAKLDNAAQGDHVVGKRDQSVAMIADRAGQYELPPLRVQWWDTAANQVRETTLPGRTLTILPAAGGSSSAAGAPPAKTESAGAASEPAPAGGSAASANAGASSGGYAANPWLWASLVFAGLWVGTLAAWWASQRRKARAPTATPRGPQEPAIPADAAHARRDVQAACLRNDAAGARRALLAWARAAWPAAPPRGLGALAELLGSERITPRLQELDRACYGGAAWNGAALLGVLGELAAPRSGPGAKDAGLAPLYP